MDASAKQTIMGDGTEYTTLLFPYLSLYLLMNSLSEKEGACVQACKI